MQLKPEQEAAVAEEVNPFQKAMKDQRLDYNYITSVRREVINLIEPFRIMALETKQRNQKLEAEFVKCQTQQTELETYCKKQFQTVATTHDMKQRIVTVQHELQESIDKMDDHVRGHRRAIDELEKKVVFVNDLQKTFKSMQNSYSEMANKVMNENLNHRDKIRQIVSEFVTETQSTALTMKIDYEKIQQKAMDLENITKNYNKDKKEMSLQISQCLIKSQQLGLQTEELLRQGNHSLRKETEQKMCHFTENLILEFKYLNQRLEDKILFKVGFYQQMPEDERNPIWPDLKILKDDIKFDVRPRSALPRKLDFNMALEKATEEAGERLKNAYQQSVVVNPFLEAESTIDMEWEVARLQELIIADNQKNKQSKKSEKEQSSNSSSISKSSSSSQSLIEQKQVQTQIQTVTKMIQTEQKRVQLRCKKSQFPEGYPIEIPRQELLWFKDESVREQRQILTLNQIWRFISQQIDEKDLIGLKIKRLEELEEDETDSDDDEIKQQNKRSNSTLKDKLQKDLEYGRSTTNLPTVNLSKANIAANVAQSLANRAKDSAKTPNIADSDEIARQIKNMKEQFDSLVLGFKRSVTQKPDLILKKVGKVKKSKISFCKYIDDLHKNMHTITEGYETFISHLTMLMRLVEGLDQRINLRFTQFNQRVEKNSNGIENVKEENKQKCDQVKSDLEMVISRANVSITHAFNERLKSEELVFDICDKMKLGHPFIKMVLKEGRKAAQKMISEHAKKNKLNSSVDSISSGNTTI